MRYFSKKIIKNLKEAMENDDEFKKSLAEDKETCVLCGKHINGHGNNPAPLADEGKCCDECNKTKVIPARMKAMQGKEMDEGVEGKGNIKILSFNHDDPEYVYGICNLTADQAKEVEEYFEYSEDVSNFKGLYVVGNNDESFYFYDGSKYSTPEEWDEAVYQALVQDAKDNPDEDVLYVELGDLVIEIAKDELESNKHYVTDMVKDSYVDGDSGAQYFFVKFTDKDIEPLESSGILAVYDSFETFEDEMEEIEIDSTYHDASEDELRKMEVFEDDDEMDYDDDYTIDYEDEDEEAIEYDDDPNMDY